MTRIHRTCNSIPALGACLLPVLWHNAAADHTPTHRETEADFIGVIDTVISATRVRQPLTESPSSITIIDRETIVASGALEIADVLRLVPGIQVSYPTGNQLAVTYHGFADAFPRSMQVLVDGRSIYQPSFADVDWVMLGIVPEDIERIEVIRGPNSPLYGSNAVAGVINIITRLPWQDSGTLARITGGDLNTRQGMVRHADRLGELDYRVTLNYQEDTGFPGNENSTNDGRQLGSLAFRGTWNPQPRDEVDLQLGLADGDLGAGAEPPEDPLPHDKDVTSSYSFVKWRRALANEADLSLHFYYNYYRSNDDYRDLLSHAAGVDPSVVPLVLNGIPDQFANFGLFDYRGERYDTELQYTSPLAVRWRMVTGLGLRQNRMNSEVLTNRDTWLEEYSERAFANIGYQASDRLLLNFGAMAEHSNIFGAYLSPRAAANWLFDQEHSVRISYARAKRNPSLVEAHFNNTNELDDGTPYLIEFISDDPGPETLTSIELGYIGYWLERRLLLDAKLFHEETDDQIRFVVDRGRSQPFPALDAISSVQVVTNDGHYEVDGMEIQLKYQTGPRDFISLQAAQVDTEVDWNRQLNPDIKRHIIDTVTPRWTWSLLASKSLPYGFETSGAWYHHSSALWLGDGDRLNGYDRFDLRLAKRWREAGSNMMLEGIVQNTGVDYSSFRNENIFETRTYLRFSIAWR